MAEAALRATGRLVGTALLALLCPAGAVAQSFDPGPPGPFVVDVRGVAIGLPTGAGLYPSTPADATLPARGFGGRVGAHLYPLAAGVGRLGFGVDATLARGTAEGAGLTIGIVEPGLSLNFGTADGWSYLGAAIGAARVEPSPGTAITVRTIAVAGGARWFVSSRLGLGFEVRVHRLAAGARGDSALGPATLVSAGVGLSVK